MPVDVDIAFPLPRGRNSWPRGLGQRHGSKFCETNPKFAGKAIGEGDRASEVLFFYSARSVSGRKATPLFDANINSMQGIPDLTSEEREIVKATLRLGHVWISASEDVGEFVETGGKSFYRQPEDTQYTKRYRDALDRLIARGMVRHVTGNQYVLTSIGFEVREELNA